MCFILGLVRVELTLSQVRVELCVSVISVDLLIALWLTLRPCTHSKTLTTRADD